MATTGDYNVPNPVWTSIPGFFDYLDLYQKFVDRCVDGDVIVEVGCYLGRSACCLGDMIQKSGKKVTVLAVDIWPSPFIHNDGSGLIVECPFEIFYNNVRQADLAKIIIPIHTESLRAATLVRNGLACVFIDGSHDYENCAADIDAWMPKVRPGGIIAGHDYDGTFPGVIKAATEKLGNRLQIMNRSWFADIP